MGKEGTPLFAFAEVFDPTFEDLVEPYGPSPADGDPLEDGLSVPVGVDPATRVTAVVALHSFPGQDQIVLPRTLHTTGLPEGFGLGEGTQRLATACEAGSVCVRGPGISWRARRDLCVRPGQPPATVSAGQVRHLRAPRRASGRAMRSTPCRPPRSLRMGGPESRGRPAVRAPPREPHPITRVNQRTPLPLGTHDLLPPARLLALSLEEFSQLLRQAGSGHSGRAAAVQVRRTALTTLALPPADATVSSSRPPVGRSSPWTSSTRSSGPPEHRIRDLLAQVGVRHHRDEIPFCGPLAIGTVLGELSHPGWLRTADEVVARCGLDPPCPPRPGDRPQACRPRATAGMADASWGLRPTTGASTRPSVGGSGGTTGLAKAWATLRRFAPSPRAWLG